MASARARSPASHAALSSFTASAAVAVKAVGGLGVAGGAVVGSVASVGSVAAVVDAVRSGTLVGPRVSGEASPSLGAGRAAEQQGAGQQGGPRRGGGRRVGARAPTLGQAPSAPGSSRWAWRKVTVRSHARAAAAGEWATVRSSSKNQWEVPG